jgi:hypothetical protein
VAGAWGLVLKARMNAFPAGAAIAARSLGYASLASLIVSERLEAEQIARLFMLSASRSRARDLTVILSAGAIARFKANPKGWSGETERQLARQAMARQGEDLNLDELSGRAATLVKQCWPEIKRRLTTP